MEFSDSEILDWIGENVTEIWRSYGNGGIPETNITYKDAQGFASYYTGRSLKDAAIKVMTGGKCLG